MNTEDDIEYEELTDTTEEDYCEHLVEALSSTLTIEDPDVTRELRELCSLTVLEKGEKILTFLDGKGTRSIGWTTGEVEIMPLFQFDECTQHNELK